MSKKKGVSAEEKRDRMLEIFHESADVFVLKDIEKLSVKKGIIAQAVKDVLQSLVDDNLVHCEKIGSSNYYWSFPAEASTQLSNEARKLEADIVAAKRRQVELRAAVEKERASKKASAERIAKQTKLRALQQHLTSVRSSLSQYAENDPETVGRLRDAAALCKSAANRWLDNTYALQSFCKKMFDGHGEQLADFFKENGLTDSIDYLE